MTENKERIPDYIVELQTYLRDNYEKEISLDEISSFLCYSKYHIEKEFKYYTDVPINQYLIQIRMGVAKKMLKETDIKITEISRLAGFSNYENFIKQFKNRIGSTPTSYRQYCQQPASIIET